MILKPKEKKIVCQVHRNKAVQLGSCLTCQNNAVICQIKGCINYHEENQRAHNVITLEQVRHIVTQYVNSNIEKKAYLKKMVNQYFMAARKEVQRLFTQVYQSIDHFSFDDLIFHEDQITKIDKLINDQFDKFTCEEIASILPKIVKCTEFQDGHFTHLRNYIITEKEKVTTVVNSVLLNLPEFRWKDVNLNLYNFLDISDENLKDVNTKILNLSTRPKKLRVKYIDVRPLQFSGLSKISIQRYFRALKAKVTFDISCRDLVREIIGHPRLSKRFRSHRAISARWDVDQNQFQIAVAEALLKLPHLLSITIYTGYQVTSTEYLEELIVDRSLEVRVYRKEWTF